MTYVGSVFEGNGMKIASHLCYFSYLSHINVEYGGGSEEVEVLVKDGRC